MRVVQPVGGGYRRRDQSVAKVVRQTGTWVDRYDTNTI